MLVLKRNPTIANGAIRVLSTSTTQKKPSKLQLNNAEPPEAIRQSWFAATFPVEKMVSFCILKLWKWNICINYL